MHDLLLRAGAPLSGALDVPGDKSISHRAVLLALLADGPCRATGWLDCADTRSSLAAALALGASAAFEHGVLTLTPPPAPPRDDLVLDCGNSGTTARLLLGLLAAWLKPGGPAVTLDGDASLRTRPMARVVEPLRRMGADLSWAGNEGRLPVTVRGAPMRGCTHDLAVASAQVKSALLLAGLGATGITTVRGAAGSRDHTERMLRGMGASSSEPCGSPSVSGPRRLPAFTLAVPGDPSSAAFFQAAAAIIPGSDVTVRGQSLNPTRTGALAVLQHAGALVDLVVQDAAGEVAADAGEPTGSVRVRGRSRIAFAIERPQVPALVDEIPVLAVLATQCAGRSTISGAAELRVKESDRLALLARNLRRLGAAVAERDDGLVIDGPCVLRGGTRDEPLVLETAGDHRIAMAMAVAALITEGETALDDGACVAVSFPGFHEVMECLLGPGAQRRP
ncbi:MAG: 3-phosphoshikimate 1-carboxyvinyltransferase [bacterium]|nr:3-phosphoshikimate 1-carboxyvinyltransferase [bacterium]